MAFSRSYTFGTLPDTIKLQGHIKIVCQESPNGKNYHINVICISKDLSIPQILSTSLKDYRSPDKQKKYIAYLSKIIQIVYFSSSELLTSQHVTETKKTWLKRNYRVRI